MDFNALVDVTIELFNMDNRQLGKLQNFLHSLIGNKLRKEVKFLMDEQFLESKDVVRENSLLIDIPSEKDDIVESSERFEKKKSHNDKINSKSDNKIDKICNLNEKVKEILADEKLMKEINIEGIIEEQLSNSELIGELKGLKIELKELKEELINHKEDFIKKAIKKVKEDKKIISEQKNHLKGGEKTMEEKEQIETRGCRCGKEDAEVEQFLPACEEQPIPFCCTLLVPAGFNVTEDLIMSNFELAATPVTGCFECRTDDCECGPIVATQVSIKGTIKFIADVFGVTGDGLGGFAAICCSDVICIPDFVPVCAACNANCADLRIDDVDVTSATLAGTSCDGDETWEVRGEISFAC